MTKLKVLIVSMVLVIVYLYPLPSTLRPLLAATNDTSPSATIQSRLEDLKNEIASKASQIKLEINKKLQNKAYVGKVVSVDGNRLTVSVSENNRTVITNEYTVVTKPTKKAKETVNLSSVMTDSYIIALGDVDDNQSLMAKKLIITTQPERPLTEKAWGQIITITGNQLKIKTKDDQMQLIDTSSKTAVQIGSQETTVSDLSTGKVIVVVGTKNSAGNIQARYIYTTANSAFKTVKPATSSATK